MAILRCLSFFFFKLIKPDSEKLGPLYPVLIDKQCLPVRLVGCVWGLLCHKCYRKPNATNQEYCVQDNITSA